MATYHLVRFIYAVDGCEVHVNGATRPLFVRSGSARMSRLSFYLPGEPVRGGHLGCPGAA